MAHGNSNLYIIERGLHAFTNKKHERVRYTSGKLYPAVIPKGSRVFFGVRGDVAATAMVVFKNRKSLEAVYGPIAKGVKKADISK